MKQNNPHVHYNTMIVQPHVDELDKAMTLAHENRPTSLVAGRNVVAGNAKGWGLQFGTVKNDLQKDPVYKEAKEAIERTCQLGRAADVRLMNLFLILKYGTPHLEGDIIQVGDCGCSAFFIAYVAKYLGFQGTIYALDDFGTTDTPTPIVDSNLQERGDPKISRLAQYQKKLGLTNLAIIQGDIMETTPHILAKAGPILLAHLDDDACHRLTYLIAALKTVMHSQGGYFVFHQSYNFTSIEAWNAIEDFIQEEHVFAEQNSPHFVYRFPHLGLHNA